MVAIAGALAAACSAPDLRVSDDPRGEVNGRSFEFVSTKPDGTEWTFRTRGNSLWVADLDYLEAPTTREVNGVFYPEWPESGNFRLRSGRSRWRRRSRRARHS